MLKIVFIIPPAVELLDLAGPVQVFREAIYQGMDIKLAFYGLAKQAGCSVGLAFENLKKYTEAKIEEGDFIFIPGLDFDQFVRNQQRDTMFLEWLKELSNKKVNICSICNGAFILGEAGLLNARECTTHWRSMDLLQQLYPAATVLKDVLFVKSANIYTSAGVTSGIDLVLAIVEKLKDPFFAHKVSRGLVVYHRRSSDHSQSSIYLDYRNHINPAIHTIQNYVIENLSQNTSIENLAAIVNMSTRNLTWVFKKATGTTIAKWITLIRIDRARILKNNPAYTLEQIAFECGFDSARQLHRILKPTIDEKLKSDLYRNNTWFMPVNLSDHLCSFLFTKGKTRTFRLN